jgi:thiol:disulfide interchange protein
MNTNRSLALLFVFAAALFLAPSPRLSAAEAPKGNRPNIYDESLDGSQQITDALAKAKKDNQRILIQFGANWCGWCHKLHRLFDADAAVSAELKAHYVVILVDVNKGHNLDLQKKYAAESLGLPSLVVLDSAGKHLKTQNTGDLEEGDHHSPAKVLAFLKEWAPGK